MQQLYSSAEASRATGIADGTIRSWLSRHSEIFVIGKHIVEQEGKRFWTDEGLALLKKRAAENAANGAANSDAETVEAVNSSLSNLVLDKMLDSTARQLAIDFFSLLPDRVVFHVQRMMRDPSPEERELVEASVEKVMEILPLAQGKQLPALPEAETQLC